MFSNELLVSPWSYYCLDESRVDIDNMWTVYRYHENQVKPRMCKDKEHGCYCEYNEGSAWCHAVVWTNRLKRSYAKYEEQLRQVGGIHS
jgi:hypothetical protein